MRFRTRIFWYLTLGILALILLLFHEQNQVQIPNENIQIVIENKINPKVSQEPKVQKLSTVQPRIDTTKSTTESIEEQAVIKAFFGPNMTKEAVKQWQMQHVTGELTNLTSFNLS